MKLIIGLGNPETRYDGTRHNIGFHMLDAYAAQHNVIFQAKDKFKAMVAELTVDGEKVLLVKPSTYYNDSGVAGRAMMDFYKLAPSDILVIHDELALPFGTVRTRQGGSDAGNNGVKSLNQHIGPDTYRIRLGIWNELRDQIDDADFVLSRFTKTESLQLDETFSTVGSAIDAFIADHFVATTH